MSVVEIHDVSKSSDSGSALNLSTHASFFFLLKYIFRKQDESGSEFKKKLRTCRF